MKMKNAFFALCTLLVMSSCVYSGKDGRMWVANSQGTIRLPLPRDPLREAVIDRPVIRNYERKQAALQAAASRPAPEMPAHNAPRARNIVSNELQPPPAGYMFSSRRVAGGGYEIRGVTGRLEKLSFAEHQEFMAGCRERGWLVYQYQSRQR